MGDTPRPVRFDLGVYPLAVTRSFFLLAFEVGACSAQIIGGDKGICFSLCGGRGGGYWFFWHGFLLAVFDRGGVFIEEWGLTIGLGMGGLYRRSSMRLISAICCSSTALLAARRHFDNESLRLCLKVVMTWALILTS